MVCMQINPSERLNFYFWHKTERRPGVTVRPGTQTTCFQLTEPNVHLTRFQITPDNSQENKSLQGDKHTGCGTQGAAISPSEVTEFPGLWTCSNVQRAFQATVRLSNCRAHNLQGMFWTLAICTFGFWTISLILAAGLAFLHQVRQSEFSDSREEKEIEERQRARKCSQGAGLFHVTYMLWEEPFGEGSYNSLGF